MKTLLVLSLLGGLEFGGIYDTQAECREVAARNGYADVAQCITFDPKAMNLLEIFDELALAAAEPHEPPEPHDFTLDNLNPADIRADRLQDYFFVRVRSY